MGRRCFLSSSRISGFGDTGSMSTFVSPAPSFIQGRSTAGRLGAAPRRRTGHRPGSLVGESEAKRAHRAGPRTSRSEQRGGRGASCPVAAGKWSLSRFPVPKSAWDCVYNPKRACRAGSTQRTVTMAIRSKRYFSHMRHHRETRWQSRDRSPTLRPSSSPVHTRPPASGPTGLRCHRLSKPAHQSVRLRPQGEDHRDPVTQGQEPPVDRAPAAVPKGQGPAPRGSPQPSLTPDDPRRGRAGGVDTCFQDGTSSLQLPPGWVGGRGSGALGDAAPCRVQRRSQGRPLRAPSAPPPPARCLGGVPRAVPSRSP
ncbi:uncharacterized protein [Physeter macrocephalus]|uniref:Uncharacterized protein n=1 Tax=Physeter macrocephalus TaxID=9755 RepID=A0A455BIL1_PHYMC|nr:uncharacterized protein LOC114485964 [Physeter catodon]|eukprot:XP_028343776.1 uncharacterized protein LOC114485964 [Physeter catodon]